MKDLVTGWHSSMKFLHKEDWEDLFIKHPDAFNGMYLSAVRRELELCKRPYCQTGRDYKARIKKLERILNNFDADWSEGCFL